MAVRCGDKTRSHIVAEKRNFRDVGSVFDRQDAAGVAAVFGVPQRRVGAKAGLSKINAGLRHRRITDLHTASAVVDGGEACGRVVPTNLI